MSLISFQKQSMSNYSLVYLYTDQANCVTLDSIFCRMMILHAELMVRTNSLLLNPLCLLASEARPLPMISTSWKNLCSPLSTSLLGWIGTTVSPFCSEAARRLQQCLSDVHVSNLIKQKDAAQELKRLVQQSPSVARVAIRNMLSLFLCLQMLAGHLPLLRLLHLWSSNWEC